MEKMLFAAFTSQDHADKAVQELHSLGYSAKDISVITKHNRAVETTSLGEKTATGAVEGATTGGVIGGVAGLLAGAGIFPALAGLLIGGPIAIALGLSGIAASTLSGVITGAVAGGLIGALTNLGLSRDDASYYNEAIDKGGILIAVPLMDRDEESVRATLAGYGAEQIREVHLPQSSTSNTMVDNEGFSSLFASRRQPMAAHQKAEDNSRVEHLISEDPEGQNSDIVRY